MTDTTSVERRWLWGASGYSDGPWVRATDYDALAAKLAEVEADVREQRDLRNHQCKLKLEAMARTEAAEAALPAVYRLAMGDAAERLLAAVTREYKDHRDYRNAVRALPTPTAAELMARIQTGDKE
jgi:hypothetical protein